MIQLRSFDLADSEQVASWINSSREAFWWTAHSLSFPIAGEDLSALINSYGAERLHFGIWLQESLVGYIELGDIDHKNHSARIGRVLVDPAHRGQRIASIGIQTLISWAYDNLLTHRVDLLVASLNRSAIASYHHAGFEFEGSLKDARYFDGIYYSMDIMSTLTGH